MHKAYVGEQMEYPGLIKAWLAFVRPKTWQIAIMPVLATIALAYSERHVFHPLIFLCTISIAILLQALSNMQNDLGYTLRKAETGNRKGFPRATAMGWISIRTAKIAIAVMAVLTLLNTAVLVWFGGWIFAAVGVLSLLAAYCYMGGPKPIAYTPFGELVVLLTFGITSVWGTYYLQTGGLSINAALLGLALGCFASAVLCVNNYRDREHDASIGRKTLAVVMGEENFKRLFTAILMIPYGLVCLMVLIEMSYWTYFFVMLTFPSCMHLPERMVSLKGAELNKVMLDCIYQLSVFSLFFMAGATMHAILIDLTVSSLK